MEFWQIGILIVYGLLSSFVFVKGLYESTRKNNAYGEIPELFWMGIFVWGDAVVFGLFWFLSSTIACLLNDWLLFLLTVSVFWVVRSLGETFYWFNQQFSKIDRNPPNHMRGYKFFKNDSIWFVYQIIWQCITVVAIITTIYLGSLWVTNL